MARDAQGRFVLGGYCAGPNGNNDFGVIRLGANGQLDPTFGENGQMTYSGSIFLSPDYDNSGGGIAVQPDGKILIGGNRASTSPSTGTYYDYEFLVVRAIGDTLFEAGFE
jgi:hypothetical protein